MVIPQSEGTCIHYSLIRIAGERLHILVQVAIRYPKENIFWLQHYDNLGNLTGTLTCFVYLAIGTDRVAP